MEYYLALKMNEILTHTTLWMNLEDTMLREINQIQSTNTVESIYSRYLETSNSCRQTEGAEFIRGWHGQGVGSSCLKIREFHS